MGADSNSLAKAARAVPGYEAVIHCSSWEQCRTRLSSIQGLSMDIEQLLWA